MILECSNLKKSYSGIDILKDITFKVENNDHIALIGVNGAGKTTLLRLIIEEEAYDGGDIFKTKDISIGYLSQQHSFDLNKTIYEVALDVFENILAIEAKIQVLEQQMIDDHSQTILNEYDYYTECFRQLDGYSYPSKIMGVLKGLGFLESEFQDPVGNLSGGQKTRLALACILLQEPDLLLLDEPTNHLDHEAITFLESYLKNYRNAIIVVSHDRYFIDQISNKIIEIEHGKSSIYHCRYQEYALQKKTQRDIDLKHYIDQQKEIKRIQKSIDTLKSYNREKQVKRAESKEKQLAKIELLEKPEGLPDSISISFQPMQQSGFDVLKVNDVSCGYDDILFEHADFMIQKNERVALLGANGIGKTTLLKTILNQLPVKSGKITLGSRVDVAYYDQEHESLSFDKTVFSEIHDQYPLLNNTQIRNTLALFNFRGDDVLKEINQLSGGEKSRVVLTSILLKQANFLILDEPTNHLDIASKEALEDALLSFQGTILFISHDRYFINKIATRVIELTPKKTLSYQGNYDDYIAHKQPIIKEVKTKDNFDYMEKKKQVAINRKQQNKIKKIERGISSLEETINQLNQQLADETIIQDYLAYNKLLEEIKVQESKLEDYLIEWEELQE